METRAMETRPAALSPLAAAFACDSSEEDDGARPPRRGPPRRPRARAASPPKLPELRLTDDERERVSLAREGLELQLPPRVEGLDALEALAEVKVVEEEVKAMGEVDAREVDAREVDALEVDASGEEKVQPASPASPGGRGKGSSRAGEDNAPASPPGAGLAKSGSRSADGLGCGAFEARKYSGDASQSSPAVLVDGIDFFGEDDAGGSGSGSEGARGRGWYGGRGMRYSAPAGSRYTSLGGGGSSSEELELDVESATAGEARRHARTSSSSAVLSSATSRLKKGWRAVKKSGVKGTAQAGRQLSSLGAAYWKTGSAGSVSRAGLPMTPAERAAWEERQSSLCDEWTRVILPAWGKKRSSARTRDLAFRGIPPGVRGKVWEVALGNALNVTDELFEVLKDRAHDGRMEFLRSRETLDRADGDVGGCGGQAEPVMLAHERSAHKAIMLDLPRTFPELAFFHADGSMYEDALREVLEAFMYLRPDIGYSQGMSFLAAVLLLYMDDSAMAFTSFANMLLHQSCFLHFFRMKMPEVRIYLSMHDRFVREEMPALHAHFKEHGVDPDLYMINWVMSLYCGALPLDLVSRIWDIYVLDGDVAIFRAALGILKILMPRLLSMGFEDMAYLLSHIPRDIEADSLMLSVRSIRVVTKQKFKDVFRSCKSRFLAAELRQADKNESGKASGGGSACGGSASGSPSLSRASSGLGQDASSLKAQVAAFDLKLESD